MRSSLPALAFLACLGGLGCRGGEGLLTARADWDRAAQDAHNATWLAHAGDRPSERNGRGRKGKGDAGVYVDGRYAGALRFQELPAALETTWFTMQDGRKARRYTIADYLGAIGVELGEVRALHLHGGRARVTLIDGDELRRTASRLHISFTKGDGGDPQFRYPGVDLRTNTAVDKISAMAVYVDKTPPVRQNGQLVLDGQVLTGLAHGAEAPKGTRVYLDGRFVGAVRHGDLAADGTALGAALASLGVSRPVASLRLVARDELALEGDARLTERTVRAASQSRGRILVDGVAGDQPIDAVVLSSHARKTNTPPGKLAGADHLARRPLGG
jgi:hypothetical protein